MRRCDALSDINDGRHPDVAPQEKKPPRPPVAEEIDCSQLSFESGLEELERFVRQLEQGQLGRSESLAAYQQGVARLRHCYALLEEAERKIEVLSGVDSEGNPVTSPYDDEDESLEEKMESRSRRRTAKRPARKSGGAQPADDVDDSSKLF